MNPREAFEALVARTNPERPRQEDVAQLRQALTGDQSVVAFAGSLAQQSQQVLLNSIKLNAASREAIEAQMGRLQAELERDESGRTGNRPLERLLIEHIVLCSLRYYLWECAYHARLANSNDARAARDWEAMLNLAQKRYLRAMETLARIRRLNIAVQVNIATDGGQQVNLMGRERPTGGILGTDQPADSQGLHRRGLDIDHEA